MSSPPSAAPPPGGPPPGGSEGGPPTFVGLAAGSNFTCNAGGIAAAADAAADNDAEPWPAGGAPGMILPALLRPEIGGLSLSDPLSLPPRNANRLRFLGALEDDEASCESFDLVAFVAAASATHSSIKRVASWTLQNLPSA